MSVKRLWVVGLVALGLVAGGGAWAIRESSKVCCAPDAAAAGPRMQLGLMTGLPLYWPLEASFEQIAQNDYDTPWFRTLTEPHYELIPLDTLSPIPALDPSAEPDNLMEGIEHFALIQPRGLAPSDNVALDEWVRAGGRLLLVLDPQLSGHYELPLGHPRFPSITAFIPPVVERWGLAIQYDGEQSEELAFAALPDAELPVHLYGEIAVLDGAENTCRVDVSRALAQCDVGAGRVTLLADAAVFEHDELAGEEGELLSALMSFAFLDSEL